MSVKKNSHIPDEIMPKIDELPGDLSQLARVIEEIVPGNGVRVVLKLAKEYRGTTLYFHNLDALEREVRDQRIIERYSAGDRAVDIAREVCLSERQVWKILGSSSPKIFQMNMF